MDSQKIVSMLPTVIPIVMKLLNTGSAKQGDQGDNPVLNAFLDADGDGEVDMGDMMGVASRFL